MNYKYILKDLLERCGMRMDDLKEPYSDEVHIKTLPESFKSLCLGLHKELGAPAIMLFAEDERASRGVFVIRCVFLGAKYKRWFFVDTDLNSDNPRFDSLAKEMYSANLFEREIKEMFGIEPVGNPDQRRLNLHDEVWPEGFYPLRKDFDISKVGVNKSGEYKFKRIDGEGVFEIPVGPVHAGTIGPGHFRFSSAGEPIISMEARLGFTHRGVEKKFEGKSALEAVKLAECVSGDSAFGHSLAFSSAIEKICGWAIPEDGIGLRVLCLELERMYNHVNDAGGMALDTGFSFPSMYASIIKENILELNKFLTGSRYNKGFNTIGGVAGSLSGDKLTRISDSIKKISESFKELKNILNSSVSFMDRVDTAGTLRKKTAEDLGVVGLPARASGISMDLRKDLSGIYDKIIFNTARQTTGDALARLNIRIEEFETSVNIVNQVIKKLGSGSGQYQVKNIDVKGGSALGYAEGWRGPILYWVKLDPKGVIERCKVVDPSFHNWTALTFAVLGNIVPDFPLCNKSFDLSYSGNDL